MSAALVFGTGIHAAIEGFYRAELAGEARPDVEQLMFAYRSAWPPHDPEAIQFGSSEPRAPLDAPAAKMLAAFLKSLRQASTGGCWASRRRSGAR